MGRSGINDNSIEFNFDDNSKKEGFLNEAKKETFGVKQGSGKQVKKPPVAVVRASGVTHYEEFRHPNMMTTVSNDILIHPKYVSSRTSGAS